MSSLLSSKLLIKLLTVLYQSIKDIATNPLRATLFRSLSVEYIPVNKYLPCVFRRYTIKDFNNA